MPNVLDAHKINGPLVAAQQVDRWVVPGGNVEPEAGELLVITEAGDVFRHSVSPKAVTDAVKYDGPAVAANEQDNHVFLRGGQIFVITRGGQVFVHDVPDLRFVDPKHRNVIEPARELSGPLVAGNHPQDEHVIPTARGVMVITNNGDVFGHDITQNGIGDAFKYAGPPVAANRDDKWVLLLGSDLLLVITTDGRVFAHRFTGTEIAQAFEVPGPPVAAQPVDHHVFTSAWHIFVITIDGGVFAHPTAGLAPRIA